MASGTGTDALGTEGALNMAATGNPATGTAALGEQSAANVLAGTSAGIGDEGLGFQGALNLADGGGPEPPQQYSIFAGTETPANVGGDATAQEVGTRFYAEEDGFITAIKFYKGPSNVGPFSVSLWSAAGVRIGGEDTVSVSGSGWKTVPLTTPVPVTANDRFIASYHTGSGHYAFNNNYFTVPAGTEMVFAPAHTAPAPNGVYKVSATRVFPTDSHLASNYWVDVVFEPGSP